MKIREAMTRDVTIVSPEDTIRDAAVMMSHIDAGSLPVGQSDRLVGMLTDRDIAIRAVGTGRGPDTKVEEIMSTGICYCYEHEEAEDVCRNLADQQIRRIPVVDQDKRLVGDRKSTRLNSSH